MSDSRLIRRLYRRSVLVPWWRLRREVHAWKNSSLPKILETSIPKSGTHLIKGALVSIGYRHLAHQPLNPDVRMQFDVAEFPPVLRNVRSGEFITEHLRWTPDLERLLIQFQFKPLFIYRDPRAVCLSFIAYHLRNNFRFGNFMRSLPDMRSRIVAVLDGISDADSTAGYGRAPLGEIYDAFLPWRTSPTAWSASFENLVGAQGGGSASDQLDALKRLFTHLELNFTEAQTRTAADKIFDPRATTFRSGRASGWRDELAPDEIHLLNSRLERQILEWGYSVDK